MRKFWILGFVSLLSVACKKEVQTVGNNVAPPDTTIESVVYDRYVNTTYIKILGREPDSTELSWSLSLLKAAKLSPASRNQFLDSVFVKPQYTSHAFDRWNVDLLNNMDTNQIATFVSVFTNALADTAYQSQWPEITKELNKLLLLRTASSDYNNHLITLREMQKRMVNNYFYDQINMQSVNFVNATFIQLLLRYPTLQEQASSVSMVDGSNAILFLKTGGSKDDYLNIFFSSSDYYEGAVVRAYNDYLLRPPVSFEMSAAATKYKASGNYEQMLKDILSSNEFVGIK
jgi:hypothetical protein